VKELTGLFAAMPALYIATATTAPRRPCAPRTRAARPTAVVGNEEYNFFLAVIFPDNQLRILPYYRAVHDLNGRSAEEFSPR